MKKLFTFSLLFLSLVNNAQIKGVVTDEKGETLPSVTILLENSYNNTTTNEIGLYELNVKNTGKHTIIFQYLGFKTKKITIDTDTFPYTLNVQLTEEKYLLSEVSISSKEDPAKQIIRNAIAAKKANSEKSAKYNADFYSRGIFRIKDAPKIC